MPWFRNHYICTVCQGHWLAEHAEQQESDCPHCRAYDIAPYKSDDWSRVIERDGDKFVVLECVRVNAHGADYRTRKRFTSQDEAKAFLAGRKRHRRKTDDDGRLPAPAIFSIFRAGAARRSIDKDTNWSSADATCHSTPRKAQKAFVLLLLGVALVLSGCETDGSTPGPLASLSAATAKKDEPPKAQEIENAKAPAEEPMTHARAASICWMTTEKGRADANLDKRADVVEKCIAEKMK